MVFFSSNSRALPSAGGGPPEAVVVPWALFVAVAWILSFSVGELRKNDWGAVASGAGGRCWGELQMIFVGFSGGFIGSCWGFCGGFYRVVGLPRQILPV